MTCHTKALERWHMIKSWHQPDIFLFHIKTFMEKSVLSPLPVVDVAAIEVAAWLALKMEFILISELYWIRGCQPEESCSLWTGCPLRGSLHYIISRNRLEDPRGLRVCVFCMLQEMKYTCILFNLQLFFPAWQLSPSVRTLLCWPIARWGRVFSQVEYKFRLNNLICSQLPRHAD